MKTRTRVLTVTSALIAGALLTAHHVPVPLSHVVGSEILTEVKFHTSTGNFGVPPYFTGSVEVEHDLPIAVHDGDTIYIKHGSAAETIVFETADFVNIEDTNIEEVMAVISAKSQLVDGFEENSFSILRGTQGGPGALIAIDDLVGNVLQQMEFNSATVAHGTADLDLVVSVPDGDHEAPGVGAHPFANHPYVVLISATDGEIHYRGTTIPVGLDPVLQAGLRATFQGQLAGFRGLLDDGGDSLAHLPGALVNTAFAGHFPDKLYFAYVVFEPGTFQPVFVSNRFTVDFQ